MSKKAIRGITVAAICSAGITFVSAPTFAANSGDITFSAELLPSTTVTIPTNPVGVNITPSSAGAFGSTSFNVTVSTNQPGYTLSMTTSSTSLASTTINPETNEYFTIPTLDFVSSGYTESNFTRNRWGISIDGSNYNAIAASQQLKDTDTATNADITTIGVGANLDLLTASGSYSTTIEFIVVPKIVTTPPSIEDITYLQDFSAYSRSDLAAIKNSMTTNQAYQLIDGRDNTTYHVAKLIDNGIWFLDNLALDLTNSAVLNDLSSANTNATTASLTALKSGNRVAGDQYATAGVANLTSGNSYNIPLVNMASKDVIPADAPTNGAGYKKVGGYYNFCAASAGSYCYDEDKYENGSFFGDATEDICPAGWKLPSSDKNTEGDYYALATIVYGTDDYEIMELSNPTKAAEFRTMLSLPFSGDFYDGSVEGRDKSGSFWTNTINGNAAYFLHIGGGSYQNILPYEWYDQTQGNSIRCVVK